MFFFFFLGGGSYVELVLWLFILNYLKTSGSVWPLYKVYVISNFSWKNLSKSEARRRHSNTGDSFLDQLAVSQGASAMLTLILG